MKTTEQIRFEAFWVEHLPDWFTDVVPMAAIFAVDANDNYCNDFAKTAWGAWNAAQYSAVDTGIPRAKKKGVHKKGAHPWRNRPAVDKKRKDPT